MALLDANCIYHLVQTVASTRRFQFKEICNADFGKFMNLTGLPQSHFQGRDSVSYVTMEIDPESFSRVQHDFKVRRAGSRVFIPMDLMGKLFVLKLVKKTEIVRKAA